MSVLDQINSPGDVKKLDARELAQLCAELREFLVGSVSGTGGHLASNLGVVEMTVAIHRMFDTARDRLVFDVGHQSYVHKLLSGRRDGFGTLRRFGGLSGYPKPCESEHDAFIAGHASNSVSVALGMARSRTLSRGGYSVAALIGDGALTGGLAYEGLCDLGESGEPLVVILNDNGMSITPNVGGMAKYLSRQRLKPSYAAFKKRYRRLMELIPGGRGIYRFIHRIKTAVKEAILHCSMFEEMGLQYIGPVDGHDIGRMEEALSWAKKVKKPCIVHVITQKGRGYRFSEENPDKYHGVSPFDPDIGVVSPEKPTFSSVFGDELTALAGEDARVCAITASMTSNTGLGGFARRFPDRFFDVGIAEGHAAAMAAGLASQGMIPVFAVYATFLQRAYDMLLHDVGIEGLHVVLGVDRAGPVAGDGETHQGIFDIGFLASVPNMTVLCPSSFAELRGMLRYAVRECGGPVAVRYPRGGEGAYTACGETVAPQTLRSGKDFTVVTYGVMVNTALQAAQLLSAQDIKVDIIKLNIVCPIALSDILSSVRKTRRLLVLEDTARHGCVGETIAARLLERGVQMEAAILKNTGNRYLPGGELDDLYKLCGIDARSVAGEIIRELGR